MPDFDAPVRRGHPIVFGLLIVFSIIELSISAFLVSRYNSRHDFPSTTVRDRVRFLLFASIWTLVFSALYLILFLISGISLLLSVLSHGLFLFITWVFWFAGAIAISAAFGGAPSCGFGHPAYCHQLQALEAFAWILWVLSMFALLVVIFRGVSASRRGEGFRGPLVA